MNTTLTLLQVASILHISMTEAARLARTKKLPRCGKRDNNVWLFDATTVLEFIKRNQMGSN